MAAAAAGSGGGGQRRRRARNKSGLPSQSCSLVSARQATIWATARAGAAPEAHLGVAGAPGRAGLAAEGAANHYGGLVECSEQPVRGL